MLGAIQLFYLVSVPHFFTNTQCDLWLAARPPQWRRRWQLPGCSCKRDHKIWSCLAYGYGSIPIDTFFSGMNIHLPAILGFTRYQGFDPFPYELETILLGSAIPSLQIWILITAQIDTSWRWIPRVMQKFHILPATSCLVAMLIPTLEQLLRLQPPWTRPVAIGWWMGLPPPQQERSERSSPKNGAFYPEGVR